MTSLCCSVIGRPRRGVQLSARIGAPNQAVSTARPSDRPGDTATRTRRDGERIRPPPIPPSGSGGTEREPCHHQCHYRGHARRRANPVNTDATTRTRRDGKRALFSPIPPPGRMVEWRARHTAHLSGGSPADLELPGSRFLSPSQGFYIVTRRSRRSNVKRAAACCRPPIRGI